MARHRIDFEIGDYDEKLIKKWVKEKRYDSMKHFFQVCMRHGLVDQIGCEMEYDEYTESNNE